MERSPSVFTDVEGSTRSPSMSSARTTPRSWLSTAVFFGQPLLATAGWRWIRKGLFFVAFPRARAALDAALEAQHALASTPVRVRIGIHTGEPTIADERFVGTDVVVAARICAAAHGGQIVVSQATRDLVDREFRDLGDHRLKGHPVADPALPTRRR